MHRVFNAFERHYRRAKYVLEPMMRTGNFGFKANWSETTGFNATVLTPDSELTTRFIVLMHRFLYPQDMLYYRTVWQVLNDEFAKEVPVEASEAYSKLDAALTSGAFVKFRYNNDDLSAEQIYHAVADGAIFQRREDAQTFLQAIAQIPFADELFRYQFYDYSRAAFNVVSLLFAVIQHIEKTPAFKMRFGDPDPSSYRCIFCLETSGKFTSEEHIIPESLGNPDWILPRGYVCDSCNNGVLARLDNALASSPLFAFQRVHFLPYDKDGRLPETRIGKTTWKRTGPRDVHITADPGSNAIKYVAELEDGWEQFSFNEDFGQKFDERVLARALCKVALECIAADHGAAYVHQDRYSAVRSFIRKGSNFRSHLLMRTKFTPKAHIEVLYMPMVQGTAVGLDIYGFQFLLNLEEQPDMHLSEELTTGGFISFPLSGKSSWQHFTVNMVPSVEMLGSLPRKYWPDEVAETRDVPSGVPMTASQKQGTLDI